MISITEHKNIKAFVTHGGLMSVQESIVSGVPMIGIPLFTDQFSNIKNSCDKNISISLKLGDITEDTLTESFKEIIYNEIYA